MRACWGTGSSRPSLRIARFIRFHSMSKPALSPAPLNHRAVFQENGHTGSSHKVTVFGALSGACLPLIRLLLHLGSEVPVNHSLISRPGGALTFSTVLHTIPRSVYSGGGQ